MKNYLKGFKLVVKYSKKFLVNVTTEKNQRNFSAFVIETHIKFR